MQLRNASRTIGGIMTPKERSLIKKADALKAIEMVRENPHVEPLVIADALAGTPVTKRCPYSNHRVIRVSAYDRFVYVHNLLEPRGWVWVPPSWREHAPTGELRRNRVGAKLVAASNHKKEPRICSGDINLEFWIDSPTAKPKLECFDAAAARRHGHSSWPGAGRGYRER